LIPDGYKEVHNIRLKHLFDFRAYPISAVVPSRVLHKELELPIKGADNELHSGLVCIRFHLDIEKGLSFVSIIRKATHPSTLSALLLFDGRVAEKQKGFPVEVLEHPDTQLYLRELKKDWTDRKVIREEQFSVMMERRNYEVKLSSPFSGFFLEMESLCQINPPIHLDIKYNKQSKSYELNQTK
jgi:hypothetical protein